MSSGTCQRLENEQFLRELEKLFSHSRTGGPGAVSITMKRWDGRVKPEPRDGRAPEGAGGDYKCLFRAKIGTRKITTLVSLLTCPTQHSVTRGMLEVAAKEVNKFQLAYAGVLKSNMDSLKKRDKTKEKKSGAASARAKAAQ